MSKIWQYIKKNRLFFILWFICLVCFLLSVCMFNMTPPENMFLRVIFVLFYAFGLIMGGIFSIIVCPEYLILNILEQRKRQKAYEKSCEEIQKLSNEFSNVKLKEHKHLSIDNEDISVTAMLDEDGRILYQIHVDVVYYTTNYTSFCDTFEL